VEFQIEQRTTQEREACHPSFSVFGVEEIAVKWHQIDDQKVIVEKLIRNGYGDL
jgi:hypothetical protein